MAPVLTAGSAATVAWGLATTGFLLLFLLLLCSFFHRANRPASTQKTKENSEPVQGVKLARLSSNNRGAALSGGTPSPDELQDKPTAGDPRLNVPDCTLNSHTLSEPALRTPEFLRHRELPVLPGNASTTVVDPMPDPDGRIYESIRYKSETQKKPGNADSTTGDSPSLPTKDELSISMQEIITQEEPGSEGSPVPVYARVCKQRRQPARPPEPQEEEEAPSLPEKRFDVG
ncbi:uncharacterized protein [Melopsittacus undulatus]|uniref:uncharacterized protein n=1 Tax=Melopsittacus undulatus TaxID=13146 RepID=UPI00146E143E|nr:uncharacterized protein LOC115946093 [Melopsittacus undulatus]